MIAPDVATDVNFDPAVNALLSTKFIAVDSAVPEPVTGCVEMLGYSSCA